MIIHTKETTCVLCNSDDLIQAICLQPSALAEDYKLPSDEKDELYPLDVYLCEKCGHAQLLDIINPERLYRNYEYQSQSSPGLNRHFMNYADSIVQKKYAKKGDLVIDIGSNDGTLLRYIADHDIRVIGVEPSKELCKISEKKGVPTYNYFFDENLARIIAVEVGECGKMKPEVITANNVFAHSRNLSDMARGISLLLDRDGVFIFEVSYLPYLIQNMVFDFIYHEHISYHTIRPLQEFFYKHNLRIIDVEDISFKGGSVRITVCKSGSERTCSQNVSKYVQLEDQMQLKSIRTYIEFWEKINVERQKVQAIVEEIPNHYKLVVYGASATTTTLLHHFEIGDKIDFIVDDNTWRHGKVSPGYHIPVKSTKALYEEEPEYCLVAAWRFKDMILEKHREFLENGHFIFPLPEVEVL